MVAAAPVVLFIYVCPGGGSGMGNGKGNGGMMGSNGMGRWGGQTQVAPTPIN